MKYLANPPQLVLWANGKTSFNTITFHITTAVMEKWQRETTGDRALLIYMEIKGKEQATGNNCKDKGKGGWGKISSCAS